MSNNGISSKAQIAQARLGEIVERGKQQGAQILQRILADAPEDALVPTRRIRFASNPDDQRLTLSDGAEHAWRLHPHALSQVAERAGIPAAYVRALDVPDVVEQRGGASVSQSNAWRRELLAHNLHELFARSKAERLLVRAVRGEARGVLSDRFRRLDTRPLLEAFVSSCAERGIVPSGGTASDVRIALNVIQPEIVEVEGDHVVFGAEWHNSDFGAGTYSISEYVLRLVCINGAVGHNALRQVHLGGKLDDRIEFSRRTYELDTRTMVSATRDIAGSLFSEERREQQLARLRRAGETETSWSAARGRLSSLGLSKAETERAKQAFEGEDTLLLPAGQNNWRLSNVLSWMANGDAVSADRRLELQRAAGSVLEASA
jgi:hypothetical protein